MIWLRALETIVLAMLAALLIWCGALIFADMRDQVRRIETLTENGK